MQLKSVETFVGVPKIIGFPIWSFKNLSELSDNHNCMVFLMNSDISKESDSGLPQGKDMLVPYN